MKEPVTETLLGASLGQRATAVKTAPGTGKRNEFECAVRLLGQPQAHQMSPAPLLDVRHHRV